MRQIGVREEDQHEILYKLMDLIKGLDLFVSPAENSSIVVHKVSEELGIKDPFAKAKAESNDLALKIIDDFVAEKVSNAPDPLFAAIRAAVAGNVVDLGIMDSYNLDEAVEEAFNVDFAICDYDEFKKQLEASNNVLYLGDNSGEIAFDKLLVEEIKRMGIDDINYVVKEGPVLNDATMEDAEMVGMTEVAKVITNGSNVLGTVVNRCSKELVDLLENSDLIISKGQANYESLEGTEVTQGKAYFILRMKCQLVADTLGVNFGDIVFAKDKY